MQTTAIALTGFALWYVLLSVGMGLYRGRYMLGGRKSANSFATDGSDLDALGQRITRARDNCYETLPLFAALALAAFMAGRLDITDGLAMWVLYARIGQSVVHLASTSVPAVLVRANLFFLQMIIYAIWALRLLAVA
ncbi:MAG: MAPEG family protein [Deltaproteobacteria bacterium]|nr:MAPEG family protein [Deltaproteobacteria bacterium]